MKNRILLYAAIFIIISSCIKNDIHNSKILELGISIEELVKKGVPIDKLFYAGASVKELVNAHASLIEILVIKEVSLKDIINAPAPIDDLILLLKNGDVSFSEMLESGMGVGILDEAGYTKELEELGFFGYVFDINGNQYRWVKIGIQKWITQNLRTTNYADGRQIEKMEIKNPNVSPMYYSKYYIDPFSHEEDYDHAYARIVNPSMYYSWAAANDTSSIIYDMKVQGVCPEGWRMPNKNDILALNDYVKNNYPFDSLANSLCADTLWDKNYVNGNNYFGLSILPNGFYNYLWYDGFFGNHYNPWSFIVWTSDGTLAFGDLEDIERATYWGINGGVGLYFSTAEKITPYCVRCMQDLSE